MDIRKVYEYALAREYEGKRFYEQNAERLNHAAAKNAFNQLALEEQTHIDFITEQIEAMESGRIGNVNLGMEIEQSGFFSQRALSELVDQTILEAMVPDLPVLRMAYLIERDFAEFYEVAALRADGDAKQVFEMLANWEHVHESLFKQFHDRAFEEYSQMPWGG